MIQTPSEEEIKLADDLDIVIKSLENYFYFVYTPDFLKGLKGMGLLTLQPIPLGDGVALEEKLYIMGEEAPFNIYRMSLKPKSETPDGYMEIENLESIPDGKTDEGEALTLNLFNLILHIYEACDITAEQRQLIEDHFIAPLKEEIHEVKETPALEIKKTGKGFKIPTKTLKMNSKTTRALLWDDFRKPLDGQATLIPQGEDMGYSVVALNYVGDDVAIKKQLTDFDERVYNALCNLYVWAKQEIVKVTLEDIWATMNGITGGRIKISERQRANIVKSIDKLRNTDAWINVKNEFNLSFPQNTSFDNQEYRGNLLYCDGIAYTEKGVTKAAYRLFRLPILFEYCAMKKQLITIDTALLNVSDTCSNTDKVMTFRDLLISEITYMKFNPKTDRKRLLSKLYEKCTLDEPESRKGKSDDIETIRSILTSWANRKDELQFIEGFYFTTPGTEKGRPKEARKGDKIDGIYILLPDNKAALENNL